MERLRIGLAGLGRMGRIHAANLARHCPSAELVAVTDADPAVAAAVGGEAGVPALPDFDALLSEVDAVVVAVPLLTTVPVPSASAVASSEFANAIPAYSAIANRSVPPVTESATETVLTPPAMFSA